MKILFLYDFPLWGNGSGAYLRSLVKEFVDMGHEVGIIAPEERRFLESKIKQYKVDAPQIPVFNSHPELKGAKRYSELSPREITEIYEAYLETTMEAIFNFDPDVLHVNHLALITWPARYVSALMDTKYIITVHGSCLTNTLENKEYLPLTEDAVRQAKAVTMVSKSTKDRFFDHFNEDEVTRSRIIPGGVDISNFPKEVDTSHIEDKYNLKGKKVVFFAGRLTSEKGMEYLVKAADKIDGEIFIAGEGAMRKDLEKMIAKNNLGNVHLLGYLLTEELIPFYYRADVFVSPSVVAEAFGLTITEAMAARTPVIATKKGGIPLIVKDGKNGLFVKAKSADDIARKCNKLLNDDELREKMGKRARKDIEEKFTWRKVAERFEFLYKIVTGEYYKERKRIREKEKEYKKMKKKDLIKKAKEKDLDFKKSATKKELIKKLIQKIK
ncbi:MAG: glycosyltransferase family 4 protein [Patescibacteria group bacterium]